MAVDSVGNLYIAATGNCRIRRVDRAGVITTVAGSGRAGNWDGGPATLETLGYPYGVAVDTAGNLYIAEADYMIVQKVSMP